MASSTNEFRQAQRLTMRRRKAVSTGLREYCCHGVRAHMFPGATTRLKLIVTATVQVPNRDISLSIFMLKLCYYSSYADRTLRSLKLITSQTISSVQLGLQKRYYRARQANCNSMMGSKSEHSACNIVAFS